MNITVDTNVFVELILAQKRAEECEALLRAVGEGRIKGFISHFSLHAIEAMYPAGDKRLQEFLLTIERSRGLTIYETTLSDELSAAILSQKFSLDFGDTIQYYVAKKTGSVAIVSFDKHFEGLDIPRRDPAQILNDMSNP